MENFSPEEYWKAIILYGLNASTYKIAFGKTLLALCEKGKNKVSWEVLSKEFLHQYQIRLNIDKPMPQLDNSSRKTVMERVVDSMKFNLSLDEAISEVGKNAFGDVIHRFDNLSGIDDVKGMFYRFQDGKYIELTDRLFFIHSKNLPEVEDELNARWSLLEGAFSMVGHNYELSNDIRTIYLQTATERKNLTTQIPFLQGYQGNICFYCGESLTNTATHVDHVLPRQVLNNDEIWNLVLSHDHCNLSKLDSIVGLHYIEKLHKRNENVMRSNHPWKKKIELALGSSDERRKSKLMWHYENIKNVIGHNHFWGGIKNYNPETDPFYRKFITQMTSYKTPSKSKVIPKTIIQDSFDFEIKVENESLKIKSCLFCDVQLTDRGRIIDENNLAYVIRDGFPVTEGHSLFIPKRHAKDYFELTQAESNAINALMTKQKGLLQSNDPSIDGFNIGMNCGETAGQTVFHCHVHLIPRRKGDVENPRGGVRHIIAGKGFYEVKK